MFVFVYVTVCIISIITAIIIAICFHIKSNKQKLPQKEYPESLVYRDKQYFTYENEYKIDLFLYQNKIKRIYKYKYYNLRTDETLEPSFYLPDYNLVIEYFPTTTRNNLKNKFSLVEIYRANHTINFEYLDSNNDYDIVAGLKKILDKYDIKYK